MHPCVHCVIYSYLAVRRKLWRRFSLIRILHLHPSAFYFCHKKLALL